MADTSAIRLYHAPRTRSIRVRWLMEEMGLPYEIVPVQFDTRPAGDEAYGGIHPLRKVPALDDKGTVIVESLAIMQYLMGRYGPTSLDVRPDEPEYARFLQWFHFGEAGMMMPVSLLLAHTTLLPEKARDPRLAAWARSEVEHLLEFAGKSGLGEREYLAANRFTAADISLGYMLYLLKIIRQFDSVPENLKTWFKRLTGRDSWAVATAVETVSA
ncbi:glutathione S-transferase family protein [Maricaulis sp.]|uniref:glutathione S-transferase family protein n=1 Tax=Maricaulis sp. TaxID=1486257 RepID=UPI00262D7C3E|nr:glutathione S-transferase family protein [Maricaulis sp.]